MDKNMLYVQRYNFRSEIDPYRRIGEESNAKGDNLKSRVRNQFEYLQVANHYLKNLKHIPE